MISHNKKWIKAPLVKTAPKYLKTKHLAQDSGHEKIKARTLKWQIDLQYGNILQSWDAIIETKSVYRWADG